MRTFPFIENRSGKVCLCRAPSLLFAVVNVRLVDTQTVFHELRWGIRLVAFRAAARVTTASIVSIGCSEV